MTVAGPADRSVLAAAALAKAPKLEIANDRVAATILLPDPDTAFHVMNREGTGFRAQGDMPLSRLVLWSIHRTLSLEPFVEIAVPAGEVRTWPTLTTGSVGSMPA